MTSPSCEQMRRQLLDNYLRNQQQQAQVPSQTHTPIHHQTIAQNQHVFHPSQFATMQQSYANTTNTGYDGDRSDTFSEVSRMSSQYSRQTTNQQIQNVQSPSYRNSSNINNIVQINTHTQQETPVGDESNALVVSELPDNITIEEFTNIAKKWIEMDNWLKKYQEMAKQKRKQKDKLTQVITHYMTKYNIEDLNTTEGKICCKVRQVRSGVNQKVVKQKITEIFKDNEETCNAIISKIFEDREKVEKVSLRRIKITNML
jgi:hypothetical protein